MKRLSFILLLCAIVSVASAQKITHTFQDVPLSDALKYIQEQATDYNITFIYDELEDFRVTTSIKYKSVTEAIMQVIGFYPVRVVKRGESEIYVECTHKTDRHLTGTIIDENRQPVPYANVYLLQRREQRGWRLRHPLRAITSIGSHLICRLQDRLQTLRPV